jgi:hypothetical protein
MKTFTNINPRPLHTFACNIEAMPGNVIGKRKLSMAKPVWKPWHEAVTLQGDLKSGALPLPMFAASPCLERLTRCESNPRGNA